MEPIVHRLLAGCAIGLVGIGAQSGYPTQLERVPVPDNVVSVNDELLVVRAGGREGEPQSRTTIDLGPLREMGSDLKNPVLVELSGDAARRELEFRREGDSIVAELVGGGKYLIFDEPLPRLARDYALLCALDRSRDVIPRRVIDPICAVVLCASEPRTAGSLLNEFPELTALRPPLGELAGGAPSRHSRSGAGARPSVRAVSASGALASGIPNWSFRAAAACRARRASRLR